MDLSPGRPLRFSLRMAEKRWAFSLNGSPGAYSMSCYPEGSIGKSLSGKVSIGLRSTAGRSTSCNRSDSAFSKRHKRVS